LFESRKNFRAGTARLRNNELYDLLEGLYGWKKSIPWEPDESDHFEQKVNNLFEIHSVGWRMQGGMLNFKGEEAFEVAVETAIAELSEAGKNTAKDELHKAVEDLF
jgi:hypothetical protein